MFSLNLQLPVKNQEFKNLPLSYKIKSRIRTDLFLVFPELETAQFLFFLLLVQLYDDTISYNQTLSENQQNILSGGEQLTQAGQGQAANLMGGYNQFDFDSGDISKLKNLYSDRLVYMYKYGTVKNIELLLTAKSFNQAFVRYRYLKLIAEYDEKTILSILLPTPAAPINSYASPVFFLIFSSTSPYRGRAARA